ncbi:hypothetical protein NPIL_460021 [Nephila pilipes]|uniref:Uncharacterized protein n=1 Tax=Nephila pilipes TaxID=299642 RepID=A0A8X6QIX7_NEPPI|nr:hypothetical protein NPIL_460021 [Nephila pilipes]
MVCCRGFMGHWEWRCGHRYSKQQVGRLLSFAVLGRWISIYIWDSCAVSCKSLDIDGIGQVYFSQTSSSIFREQISSEIKISLHPVFFKFDQEERHGHYLIPFVGHNMTFLSMNVEAHLSLAGFLGTTEVSQWACRSGNSDHFVLR